MERKKFLQTIGLVGATVPLAKTLGAKGSPKVAPEAPYSCTITASETAGPYPSLTVAQRTTITDNSGYTNGIPLTLAITVNNSSCIPIANAKVEIWHCNASGHYSEYNSTQNGGDFSTYTFLRGYGYTDAAGLITFTSIYPGWYTPRATHIHVVVTVSGTVVLTTQLAFPNAINTTVNTYYKNNSISSGSYSGTNSTTNENDQVFSDGYTTEALTVTGSTSAGYAAAISLVVTATLPLTLLSFSGSYTNEGTQLWWATSNEINSAGFEIERSNDASKFIRTGYITALNGASNSYAFTDNSVAAGDRFFYRLKMIDKDGQYTFSKTISVDTRASSARLQITPNPVTTGQFILGHPKAVAGNTFTIITMDGRTVATGKLQAGSTSSTVNIAFLPKGAYLFVLESFADISAAKFQIQ